MGPADATQTQGQLAAAMMKEKVVLQNLAPNLAALVGRLQALPATYAAYTAAIQADVAANPTDPIALFNAAGLSRFQAQNAALIAWAQAVQTAINSVPQPAGS